MHAFIQYASMHGMGGWMDECLSVCLYVGSNLDPHNVQRSLTKTGNVWSYSHNAVIYVFSTIPHNT